MIATVTKQHVKRLTNNDFSVTIHVTITNDVGDVALLDSDYSERYNSSVPVAEVKAKLQTRIAADWDAILAEQAIYNANEFDTMVSEIQTDATAYVNV